MKRITPVWLAMSCVVFACNNSEKNSVAKADSANQANRDSAINQKTIVVDEGSTAFLVRAANGNMTEVDMAAIATQKAVFHPVKNFGSKLLHDHSALYDQVKSLALQKNIVLPETITGEKQKDIEDLKRKKDIQFDKAFIQEMIKRHEETIRMFEKALTEVKDPDINSFADKTLPLLKAHLDSAKTLQKSLHY
jgi:putative membrane protein